ncbi:MAG: helix-turn-helix transcriptional regulator [Planctomycetota bacterium]
MGALPQPRTDRAARSGPPAASFAKCLQQARHQKGWTQQNLADKLGVSRAAIANYETGKGAPEPARAVALAKALDESPSEFLLLSILQQADLGGPDADLAAAAQEVLCQSTARARQPARAHGHSSHLTLCDFPDAFQPLTVIVGDKREEEPQNAGDLFVFSASTVDDRWLMKLRLSDSTEKISDKVLMTAAKHDEWLREKLGKTHILCIGSPASNLFARAYNDHFLFRFAVSRETNAKWALTKNQLSDLRTRADLLKFYLDSKRDLKQMMRLFKAPGFVAFNYPHLKLGIDPSYSRDFAVISIGRNPFAPTNASCFAVLAAGVHHPGTACAVRFLADRNRFEKHPFGGVLEVDVPAKKYPPEEILWHERIEKSEAQWHSASGSSLEYTPEELRNDLIRWKKRLDGGEVHTDVELDVREIEEHIRLIDQLAYTEGSGGNKSVASI